MPRGVYQGSRVLPASQTGWGRRALRVGAAGAGSYNDAFIKQLTTLEASRGFDRAAASPGAIPRTTIADVAELVTFWNGAIADATDHDAGVLTWLVSPALALWSSEKLPTGGRLDDVLRGWRAETFLASHFAGNPPAEVYVRNAQLWHAMALLATELDALKDAPTKGELAKQATIESAEDLGKRLASGAWSVGKYVLVGAGVLGAALIISKLVESRGSP